MNPIAQRLDQTAIEINNLVFRGELPDGGYVWRDLMRAARDEIEALTFSASPSEPLASIEPPKPWKGIYAVETSGVNGWAVYRPMTSSNGMAMRELLTDNPKALRSLSEWLVQAAAWMESRGQ
jgi:hypothetical protein